MFDRRGRVPAASTPIKVGDVEFLRIELSPTADGKIFVSMTATTVDEEEPQLLDQEIASDRVATIDDALALIAGCLRSETDLAADVRG